jgi:O-methyltransferase
VRRALRALRDVLASTTGVELVRAGSAGPLVGAEWTARFVWFDRLLGEIDDVDGDVAECGVAGGGSLAMLMSLLRLRGSRRHVYGFDTWEGLPKPVAEDLGPGSAAEAGLFGEASIGAVWRRLRTHDFDDDEIEERVTLVRGRFDETLPRFEGKLAFLHLDADLYESYRDALGNLWPSLSPGAIVALDDYGAPDSWPGAQRAVDEFVAARAGAVELRADGRIGKWSLRKTD